LDTFNITQSIVQDNSIKRYQAHKNELITGTNLNNPGEIENVINQEDKYVLLSDSYIILNGRITKTDSTAYANADLVY